MKIGIRAFLFTILIAGYAVFNHSSFGTDAALLPNGVQQFFDNNGKPLTSGTVTTYEAGTSTLKTTWRDSAGAVANTNPIRLDAGGKAIIYGTGTYRQLVKDRNGNIIFDAVTAPGGGGSTPSSVGDGNSVGTILAWSGLVAPNQYAFAYGQELSRTTYVELYAAVTQQLSTICTASSNTLSGISDTTQINIGSPVEVSCVAAGTTVVSKTASSVVMSNAASLNLTTVARFFNYGNGNGTTTFNVPDLRGYVLAGRDNMGGVAASRLTTTYFGSNTPAALGATGGTQSHTITQGELPNVTLTTTITAGQGAHTHVLSGIQVGGTVTGGAGTAIPLSTGSTTINSNTLPAMSGSTPLGGSGTAISIVQPTITLNYVIKTTPDTPSSALTGVSSLGGMQGVIACGSGVTCAGNTISAIGGSGGTVSLSAGAGITLSPNPIVDVGSIAITSTIAAAGPVGNATTTPIISFNAQGQLTTVTSTTITPAFTSLTGSIACSQYVPLTGDITSPSGSCATTLATVNSNVGTFGSTTLHPIITVNGKGLITAVSTTTGPTYTSGMPLFGDGTAVISAGSITGTGSRVVTSTGALVNGNCAAWNASGNLIDSGAGCGGGGGSGTVASGTINQIAAYAATGTTVAGTSTIPGAVQLNITNTGTITSGTWNATVVGATYGGTGVNNGSNTITLGGALVITPNAVTFTTAGTTNVTLPTSGTLVNSAVTTLSSLTSIGTIATGVWQGTLVAGQYGGTGVANTGKTITLGGNLTTTGAFNLTLNISQNTLTYLPLSANNGTLATQSGTLTSGNCVSIDGSGNFVDAGGPCTTGGGGGTIASGTVNNMGYYASTGTTISPLATANNGVLITSGAGAPSINSTLPTAVQNNITSLGTIATGVWNGTVVAGQYGGTGVANTGKTITLGGNLTTSGAFAATLTLTNTTNVTLPTTGTLVNTAVTTLSSLASVGTLTVGTWQGTKVGLAYGGTNVDLSAAGGTSQVLFIDSAHVISAARPACSDLSNGTASCSTDTTNAANISSGTLPSARLTGSYTGITGVGTIVAGTWQGTAIDLTNYVSGTLAYARLPTQANNTVLGNVAGSTTTPIALTQAQVTTLVNPNTVNAICLNAAGDGAIIQTAVTTGKSVHIKGPCVLDSSVTVSTPGQLIYGDSRTSTILTVSTILTTGAFVVTSGEPGPIFQDFTIKHTQPNTQVRASLTAYTPAIYAPSAPRFKMFRMRISGAMTAVLANVNAGGLSIDDLECSAFTTCLDLGGADSMHINNLHVWPFDITGNNLVIMTDTTATGITVATQVDGLQITNGIFYVGTAIRQSSGGWTIVSSTSFDSFNGIFQSAGNIQVSSSNITLTGASVVPGSSPSVNQSGNFKAAQLSGGELTFSAVTIIGAPVAGPMIDISGNGLFTWTSGFTYTAGSSVTIMSLGSTSSTANIGAVKFWGFDGKVLSMSAGKAILTGTMLEANNPASSMIDVAGGSFTWSGGQSFTAAIDQIVVNATAGTSIINGVYFNKTAGTTFTNPTLKFTNTSSTTQFTMTNNRFNDKGGGTGSYFTADGDCYCMQMGNSAPAWSSTWTGRSVGIGGATFNN